MIAVEIPAAVFRFIEHNLYCYENDREEYLLLRNEIILGKGGEGIPGKSQQITDQTGRRAVQLVDSRDLILLGIRMRAIESTLNSDPAFRELYNLKYRQCLGWQEICDRMHVSGATYRRLRRRLIKEAGRRMGEL